MMFEVVTIIVTVLLVGLVIRLLRVTRKTAHQLSDLIKGSRSSTRTIEARIKNLAARVQGLRDQQICGLTSESPNKLVFFAVLSLPKCGGSAVHGTIDASFPNAHVMHWHYYSRQTFERLSVLCEKSIVPNATARLAQQVQLAFEARALLNHLNPQNIIFVAGVREPVALALSAFFQSFYQPGGAAFEHTTDEIRNLVESSDDNVLNWAELDRWFDDELLPASGHDVFAQPFPTDKGYQVFTGSKGSLCVYRIENKDSYLDAIAEVSWVPRPFLTSKRANVAEDKHYASRYRKVLAEIRFSDSFLTMIYQSRYATHFYSREELASFKQRWSVGLAV